MGRSWKRSWARLRLRYRFPNKLEGFDASIELLTGQREGVEVVVVHGEVARHDVWLIVERATQPAETRRRQRHAAFIQTQFLNSIGHLVRSLEQLPSQTRGCAAQSLRAAQVVRAVQDGPRKIVPMLGAA